MCVCVCVCRGGHGMVQGLHRYSGGSYDLTSYYFICYLQKQGGAGNEA